MNNSCHRNSETKVRHRGRMLCVRVHVRNSVNIWYFKVHNVPITDQNDISPSPSPPLSLPSIFSPSPLPFPLPSRRGVVRIPRYARVNTLLASLDHVISQLNSEGFTFSSSSSS